MKDIGQQNAGAVVSVTLDQQANVRLMTASNYQRFNAGHRVQMWGGLAKVSPLNLSVPSSGHGVVVVDLGGRSGSIRAGVSVRAA